MGATQRTRAGLRASQKAVHAHPDHSSSWAVLAASVTAHDIAKSREELGRDKSTLGARLSQFVESTGIGCTRESRLKLRFERSNYRWVRKIGVSIWSRKSSDCLIILYPLPQR